MAARLDGISRRAEEIALNRSRSFVGRSGRPRQQSSQVTGGPMVRIHLPPAVSLRTIGSRNTRSSLKRHLYIPGHLRQTVAPAADLSGGVIRQGWRFLRRKVV